jgi:hypothetical protein
MHAVVVESYKVNGRIACSCVVRCGVAAKHLPVVADLGYGVVTSLRDQWGRPVERAYPGDPVTIMGIDGTKRCPGVNTHVMQVPSRNEAAAICSFRQSLQNFVIKYPKMTPLLRPPGRESPFYHLGNFGQVDDAKTLEYDLLHGEAAQRPEEDGCLKTAITTEFETLRLESMQKHEELDAQSDDVKDDYLTKMRKLIVMIKADSYHSARMLHRELERLSSKDVLVHVSGVSFGTVTPKEYKNCRPEVLLFYRTPLVIPDEVAREMVATNVISAQFDVYSDLMEFMKARVLEVQATVDRDAKAKRRDASAVGTAVTEALQLLPPQRDDSKLSEGQKVRQMQRMITKKKK